VASVLENPLPVLILFDIDATLIVTGGAGIRAMETAGKALFGEACQFEGVEVAGRLDPLIMRDMLARAGVSATPENLAKFRAGYERQMVELFRAWPSARALPGVGELLAELRTRKAATLGLLTGNFETTGKIKLKACGIDSGQFEIGVWGDDSREEPPARQHLPPVAVERFRKTKGRDPEGVVIVGDTPHDVRCAQVHGHRSLGVATGQYSVTDLRAAGADYVVPDLTDRGAIVRWMFGPSAGARDGGAGR
jgi:phosphoglycolate phosphatase-like HAD superfamily hydrolase